MQSVMRLTTMLNMNKRDKHDDSETSLRPFGDEPETILRRDEAEISLSPTTIIPKRIRNEPETNPRRTRDESEMNPR